MSDYRDNSRIEHMIEACQKIGRLISVSRVDFDASEEKQLALERLYGGQKGRKCLTPVAWFEW